MTSSSPSPLVWVVFAVLLGACDKTPEPTVTTAQTAAAEWNRISESFVEEYFKAQPFFAAQAGRHEFDGQMPDWSAAGIKKEIARLRQARAALAAVEPASLSARQRFDREYFLAVADNDLFWLEKAEFPFKNPAWYVDRLDPDVYLNRDYAPLATRMRAYIAYASAIPKIAADIRVNLRTPLPKTFVEYGVNGFGGFADFFDKDVSPLFASVQDAALQQQLVEVNVAAARAMAELKAWLESERPRVTEDFALGKALFAQLLADTERVDLPLAQFEAAGRADLERNLAALKAECAKYLPGGAITACIAKMAANKPQGSVVERARGQLASLKDFVERQGVVSIPGKEDARVAEAPPYNRANSAYISIPGPYDQGVASIYYIAPPDPQWSKAEQDAYIPGQADLMFTSVHEAWPGHFLQFLHANANPIKLESIWVGYGFAEGWAHYSEEMMVEMGLGEGDPEIHIGQLSNALLRDVRLLCALGLHTQSMKVETCETMFREQAFQDPGNARQQAARGTYDPAYFNYTLGKLMIRKLRSDWVAQRRSAASEEKLLWRTFHDQLLSYGGPPIPLLRKELLGEAASRTPLL